METKNDEQYDALQVKTACDLLKIEIIKSLGQYIASKQDKPESIRKAQTFIKLLQKDKFDDFIDKLKNYQKHGEAIFGINNLNPGRPNHTKGSLSAAIAHGFTNAANEFYTMNNDKYEKGEARQASVGDILDAYSTINNLNERFESAKTERSNILKAEGSDLKNTANSSLNRLNNSPITGKPKQVEIFKKFNAFKEANTNLHKKLQPTQEETKEEIEAENDELNKTNNKKPQP